MSAVIASPNQYGAEIEQSASLGDFLAGFKRRRKVISIVAAVAFFFSVLAALFWPPIYSASATILIEEQQVPQDMVRSTITSFASQQIEVIRQRILTLSNIMELVEKYELYDEEELARTPRMEISQDFIDSVKLDLLSADVIDPRSGRPTSATIAFTLAFEASDPRKTLGVTNELVSFFLNENLRNRTEKASSTADFLRKEANELKSEVEGLETELAEFKGQHQASLPDTFQQNMQLLSRSESQLVTSEAQLRNLIEREMEMEAQLITTTMHSPTVLPSGETVLADADRLRALQSDYRNKAGRYSSSHPDVVRLRREIDALTAQVGSAGDNDDLQQILDSRRGELASLKASYADNHPQVVAQQQLIEQLERQLEQPGSTQEDVQATNPAYVFLDNQLRSLRMEKAALTEQIESLKTQVESLNQAAIKGPVVERQYNNLVRNLEVASAKYLDLRVKLKEAELAGQLEQDLKGQRFTLIGPPSFPEEPIAPNRLAILFLGVILAIGLGLGAGVVLEAMDESIRGERALSRLMGIAPLVTIDYIHTPAEMAERNPNRKLLIAIAIGAGLAALSLVLIHVFYKPLDVLWYVVLNKLA